MYYLYINIFFTNKLMLKKIGKDLTIDYYLIKNFLITINHINESYWCVFIIVSIFDVI